MVYITVIFLLPPCFDCCVNYMQALGKNLICLKGAV